MDFTKRSTDSNPGMSETMINLLIALLVLIFVGLLCLGSLYFLRRLRLSRAIARQSLPQYTDVVNDNTSNTRRLTITTTPYGRTSSIYVYDEKASILNNGASSPASPVPEIRITFPDEHDEAGRPKSGRVLVVRVGETGVGLEPLKEDEQLPAYEKQGFQSIDIERIGGLKEKPTYS
jgi:hypothetical protein